MKVREVKEWYVDYLANEILQDNRDLEDLTAPLLVVASSTKEDFRTREMSSYSFQVIGGLHRYLAILKINDSEEKKRVQSRKCAIYGAGMTRGTILRLANQHNEVQKVQRATAFSEVTATCRRLMYIHFGEGMEDDGSQCPQIPRYNSQKYRDWKTECMTYLSSPTTVSGNMDVYFLFSHLTLILYVTILVLHTHLTCRALLMSRQPCRWPCSPLRCTTKCRECLLYLKMENSRDSKHTRRRVLDS